MDTLEGDEKKFYKDQKAGVGRSWELSNEVDEEYEEQRAAIQAAENEQQQRDLQEEVFIMEPLEGEEEALNSDLESSVILNSSVNRSGLVRSNPSSMEASVQTDNPQPDRPLLCDVKNDRICTEAIKSACAMVSSTCGVSNEMSRKIVQIVAKELYGHDPSIVTLI